MTTASRSSKNVCDATPASVSPVFFCAAFTRGELARDLHSQKRKRQPPGELMHDRNRGRYRVTQPAQTPSHTATTAMRWHGPQFADRDKQNAASGPALPPLDKVMAETPPPM